MSSVVGFIANTPTLVLVTILLLAHGAVAHAATASGRLRVVATILPAYCLATNIGGDLVDVRYLVGAGGDGHDYQLTPRDRSDIENAGLLLKNGLGIEPWLRKTIASVPPSLRVVDLSRGLEARLIASSDAREHGHGNDSNEQGGMNPHTWLDPVLMMQMVTNALLGFQAVDPAHADRYARNASNFVARLEALDAELARGLEPLRGAAIVTFHDAFPYFARRYGLKIAGVLEEIPDVEPTARHLTELSTRIRTERVRAIFVEPRHPARLAERLGRDLGVKVGMLDTLESGVPAVDAYERGMRGILQSLRSTLR